MSILKAREYLKKFDADGRIRELELSSATVELAALALGCEGKRIAKTLSFEGVDAPILIVAAGDAKVDNHAFKEEFKIKPRMIAADLVEEKIGHGIGGVCPFGVNENVKIYLDKSLTRFETVFPACGSSNSAIELTISELEAFSSFIKWVDVCKAWQDNVD